MPDGDLVYFNWSEYIEPKLIKAFEKQYGVKVRESNFDSMQGMMAKLRSGNRYDVIFPTAEWVDRLRKANQLMRFDPSSCPTRARSIPTSKALVRPEADHTVPYTMYATGIIYRADKISDEGLVERHGQQVAKGRAYLLDDFQEVIGAATSSTAPS